MGVVEGQPQTGHLVEEFERQPRGFSRNEWTCGSTVTSVTPAAPPISTRRFNPSAEAARASRRLCQD